MRGNLLLLTALAGLSATALAPLPAAAADDVKAIAIVKNADGKFVFSDTNAKIEAGQTIKWVAVDDGVAHQLVPDSEGDALTDTGTFDSTTPASQTFATPGTIKYHCAIHPKAMRGTITVAAAATPPEAATAEPKAEPAPEPKAQAEAPVEEAPAPKQKRKARPSYGYGYGY
jgi:plastocyanin